ncbi:hypothetical protein BJ742DRAFT_806776 [Cladochytrium replicatum]|nr:hypothetical protein BJ742DRAFT_806776 [Cladochytrium replicatum]
MEVRQTHSQGHTECAFLPTASRLVTAGGDNLLVVHELSTGEGSTRPSFAQLSEILKHKSSVLCLDVNDEIIVSGGNDQTVAIHDSKSGEFICTLLDSTLAIRDVAIRPNGDGSDSTRSQVAVASDEMDIKLVNYRDVMKVINLRGHRASPKSLAFHPFGDILASVDCHGFVHLWDLTLIPPKTIAELHIAARANPESDDLCRMSWHPDGTWLAVPSKLNDVLLIDRRTHKTVKTFTTLDTKHAINAQFSTHGTFIASAHVDKSLCLWKVESGEKLASLTHSQHITALSWMPSIGAVCLADAKGQIGFVDSIDGVKVVDTPKRELPSRAFRREKFEQLFNDVENETHTVGAVGTRQKVNSTLPGDEEDDGNDDEDDDEFEEDFVVDDDGAGYTEGFDPVKAVVTYDRSSKKSPSTAYPMGLPLTTPVKAFQPGSTPTRDRRRYLAFNMLGQVKSSDERTHSIVQVELYDKSLARDFHFRDLYNYSKASLGERGVVFACESTPGGSASTVYFKPFDTWASKNEWTIQLPEGENVTGVATTRNFVVVATDKRYLRYFTYGSVQAFITSLEGDLVTLTGKLDLLIVVYAGAFVNGEQTLHYVLLNVETKKCFAKGILPRSARSDLTWIGISETGMPASFDSRGVCRGLFINHDAAWIPIIETNVRTAGYNQAVCWPVGITDRQLICVECKTREKYPFFPAPPLTELDFKIPLFNTEDTLGALEEKVVRSRMLVEYQRWNAKRGEPLDEDKLDREELDTDKAIVVLFQGACKEGKTERALDLVAMANSIKAVDGMIFVANKNHLYQLAERISVVKEGMIERQRQKEFEAEQGRTTQVHGNRRSGLSGSDLSSPSQEYGHGGRARQNLDPYTDRDGCTPQQDNPLRSAKRKLLERRGKQQHEPMDLDASPVDANEWDNNDEAAWSEDETARKKKPRISVAEKAKSQSKKDGKGDGDESGDSDKESTGGVLNANETKASLKVPTTRSMLENLEKKVKSILPFGANKPEKRTTLPFEPKASNPAPVTTSGGLEGLMLLAKGLQKNAKGDGNGTVSEGACEDGVTKKKPSKQVTLEMFSKGGITRKKAKDVQDAEYHDVENGSNRKKDIGEDELETDMEVDDRPEITTSPKSGLYEKSNGSAMFADQPPSPVEKENIDLDGSDESDFDEDEERKKAAIRKKDKRPIVSRTLMTPGQRAAAGQKAKTPYKNGRGASGSFSGNVADEATKQRAAIYAEQQIEKTLDRFRLSK